MPHRQPSFNSHNDPHGRPAPRGVVPERAAAPIFKRFTYDVYTTFDGQSVSGNDILVKYTYAGDANLDGTVNGNDDFQIDQGFDDGYDGYSNGDFNYSGGSPDGNDYFIIDAMTLDHGSTITLTGPVDGHFPNQSLYSYDAAGDTPTMTDQNDTTHTYGYDVLGREITDAVTLAAGNPKNVDDSVLRIQTSYNDQGLVYQTTSYNATSGGDVVNQVQDMYNGFGQLLQEYQSASGAVDTDTTLSVQYAYGAASTGSRLISMANPNGTEVDYNYGTSNSLNDVISRLAKITESGVTLQSYSYLGLNTVVELDDVQAGLVLNYEGSGSPPGDAGDIYTGLDRFGRVVDQYWYLLEGDDPVDEYQYTYDRDGNVTSKDNIVYDNDKSQTVGEGDLDETYTYDDLGQLTEVDRGGSEYESFTMDAVGNITVANGTDRVSNAQNELVSDGDNTLAYDNNGNTITDAAGDTLTYDAWNRLVSVSSGDTLIESYTYDGTGRRITEYDGTTTTNLYYSSQDQVLEEDQGGYAIVQNVWSAVYVNALVLRDSDSNPTDGTHTLDTRTYVTQDANYNVTGMVTESDDTWSMDLRAVYDAYGNATFYASDYSSTTTNTLGMRTLYQGMFYDAATGLYHADERDYDPNTMTWLEQDPAGYVDGSSVYQFVDDNPGDQVDPKGTVAVFMEGLGGLSDTSPPTAADYPQYAWVDAFFSWYDSAGAEKYIRSKVGEPGCQKEPIIILGHSLGGSAWSVGSDLASEGYTVNFVATLDPVDVRPGTYVMDPRIKLGWNWYEDVSFPAGVNIEGATNIFDAEGVWGTGVRGSKKNILKHTEIDDDAAIAKKIKDESDEIIKAWKAPTPIKSAPIKPDFTTDIFPESGFGPGSIIN